jgi:hypothetical protein
LNKQDLQNLFISKKLWLDLLLLLLKQVNWIQNQFTSNWTFLRIIISWQVLEKRISLYDYELILGENGERLVAFGRYAGLAGMIDLLRGLGERKNCHSSQIASVFLCTLVVLHDASFVITEILAYY